MNAITTVREQLPDGRGFVLNLETGPVRPVHRELFPPERFASVLVAWAESAFAVISRVPPHGDGPPAHWHDVDQLFYCTTGELELRVGDDQLHLTPGDLVIIPAGTAHVHRNLGDVEEVHLELIVPGIIPGRTIIHPVGEDGDWSGHGTVVSARSRQPRAMAHAPAASVLWEATAPPQSVVAWTCTEIEVSSADDVQLSADGGGVVQYVLEGTVETADGTAGAGTFIVDGGPVTVPGGTTTRLFTLDPGSV